MIDELKKPLEDIKDNFKSRLESPYWGYIFFSWLGFNWQNIARLLMSEKPVETRIIEITSQHLFFLHYWLAPVVVGIFLAVAAPYFQGWFELAHRKASDSRRKNMLQSKLQNIKDEAIGSKVADLEARGVEEAKLENLRVIKEKEDRDKTRAAVREARLLQVEKSKDSIEKAYKEAQEKLYKTTKLIEDAKKNLREKEEQQQLFTQRIELIADVYFKHNKIQSRSDFEAFLADLRQTDVINMEFLSEKFKSMIQRENVRKAILMGENE